MTRTLQNRYVVVTGDLKASRKLKDRAEVQEELKKYVSGSKEGIGRRLD